MSVEERAEAVDAVVGELVESGAATAAAAVWGPPSRPRHSGRGAGGSSGAADGEQLFDLASLTKPWVATLALVLDARGELPLDARVGDVWSDAAGELARRPLEALLRHRSGLAAWAPLYAGEPHRGEVRRRLVGGDLLGARAGTYSDLGYVLWGLAAEEVVGHTLEVLLRSRVLDPLGVPQVTAHPRPERALASPLDTGREVELAAERGEEIEPLGPPAPGEPQDGNARFLRRLGVPLPGHAGLFAPASALVALAREWLGEGVLLRRAAVERALSGERDRVLGWARRTQDGAGATLPEGAFGHGGFTGGSLWIDPVAGELYALLAHRATLDVEMDPWRRRLHAAARGARRGQRR